jgi:GNAT superfamily N-acetyltransferase
MIHEIYPATYGNILSKAQIGFMLEKSYTVGALEETMEAGQDFYLLYDSAGRALGFIALENKAEDVLRIEKLYLLPNMQGKGLGKWLIEFASEEARKRQCATLELNVNRNNNAYYFYQKQGFQVAYEIDIPYYGFVLDDYVMQKVL